MSGAPGAVAVPTSTYKRAAAAHRWYAGSKQGDVLPETPAIQAWKGRCLMADVSITTASVLARVYGRSHALQCVLLAVSMQHGNETGGETVSWGQTICVDADTVHLVVDVGGKWLLAEALDAACATGNTMRSTHLIRCVAPEHEPAVAAAARMVRHHLGLDTAAYHLRFKTVAQAATGMSTSCANVFVCELSDQARVAVEALDGAVVQGRGNTPPTTLRLVPREKCVPPLISLADYGMLAMIANASSD